MGKRVTTYAQYTYLHSNLLLSESILSYIQLWKKYAYFSIVLIICLLQIFVRVFVFLCGMGWKERIPSQLKMQSVKKTKLNCNSYLLAVL